MVDKGILVATGVSQLLTGDIDNNISSLSLEKQSLLDSALLQLVPAFTLTLHIHLAPSVG